MRLSFLGLLTLVMVLASITLVPVAHAEFSPTFDVNLSDGAGGSASADSVPLMETVIQQDRDEDMISNIKVIFPERWKVNNVSQQSIGLCPLDDLQFGDPKRDEQGDVVDMTRNNCPENSNIGTVEATIGNINDPNLPDASANGYVYLRSSDQYQETVKLGIYILAESPRRNGGVNRASISILGDVTLEGDIFHERIVAEFKDVPGNFGIRDFHMYLTNSPNGRGLIRAPIGCGLQPFRAEIKNFDWSQTVEVDNQSSPDIQSDCDPANPARPRTFDPSIRARAIRQGEDAYRAGRSPTLDFNIAGRMNNGNSGYQSLKSLKLRLPQGMAGNLFPFANGARCPSDTPSSAWAFGGDPCAAFRVGVVAATVQAAQQTHIVRGDVYLSAPDARSYDLGALRIVFPNPPVRLNPLYAREDEDCEDAGDEYNFNGLCPNPLVLTARLVLNPETYRIEAIVDELPTTYEIRQITIDIWGRPPGSVRPLIINPTSCSPRSFEAEFTSDRNILVDSSNDDVGFQATDCSLAFTPSFRFKPFNTQNGEDNGVPGSVSGASIVIDQPDGQAHMQKAEYTLARGYSANSLLDGITPCEEEDVADCGGSRSASYIGYATATTPALDGAAVGGRPINAKLGGSLHLMGTEPGGPLKIATLLWSKVRGAFGIEVRQEAYLKMEQSTPGAFVVKSGHTTPELPIRNFTAVFTKPVLKNPWLCENNALGSKADFRSYSGLTQTAVSATNLTPCGQPAPFNPRVHFVPDHNQAGKKTDLILSIERGSEQQTTRSVSFTFPSGWASDALTKPACPRQAAESSNCPDGSLIGGVGVRATVFKFLEPLEIDGGRIYNCERQGRDAGAICIDMELPEIAGGGHLVLYGRILVTDNARKISVEVDSMPTEFDIGEIIMAISGNTTPTFCDPLSAGSLLTGEAGTQAAVDLPYRSQGCELLNFGPGLNVQHSSSEIDRPTSIKTTIENSEGDATMERINLLFPKELRIDVFKLKSCSNEQRQTSSCPSGSHLGKAKIETPYLPTPLEGDLHFGESGRIYFDLSGLVKISLDGQIGIDQKSGALSFTMADIPPLLVSRAEITLDEDKVKNPKECSKATYKATFTSHSGKTSSSESSVDICGKKKTGEPTFGFKAKLRPQRKNAPTNATFTLTQKGEGLKAIKSLKIKLGKGKRALRLSQSALKRKAKAIGQIALKPEGGKPQRARLSLKRGKVRLRGVKGLKLKLKGKALKLTGLPKRPYERIVIKLNGRKSRLLKTPKTKGIVTFAATVGISGSKAVKLASGVRVKS